MVKLRTSLKAKYSLCLVLNPGPLIGPYRYILSSLKFHIPVTTILYERFLQVTETKRRLYQTTGRYSSKSPYVCYKWSLQGPVSTKTLVDCKRPRVKDDSLLLEEKSDVNFIWAL